MNFDEIIDRVGTHSQKWDGMQAFCGLTPAEAIPMWVADMDFRPPAAVQAALQRMLDCGVYGYFGNNRDCLAAIRWWMSTRHGWDVDAEAIFSTHGLVNGTGLLVDTYTQPGDGIVLMTPVYHAFARVIRAAGRRVVECPLLREGDCYGMDFDAWDRQMTGREKMLILCSPHNPVGRVWTQGELQGVADFCRRHDLLLVSDEIHHDIVMPGHRHIAMPVAVPDIADRLVMLTATTKTFNLAGGLTGNVIIPDPALRERFAQKLMALGISANAFGMTMTTAAYSPEGAEWVDALVRYIDGNARVLGDGVGAIPGVRMMPLEATYLAWVDFSGTGMTQAQILDRVQGQAKIATNQGPSFGSGGEGFLRFNIATPRARVVEAVQRLQSAFADLQ
jgi:cystathionine beta-lyase